MPTVRLLLAFVAGALFYQAFVVQFGGVLAAIAVPKAYFDGFGRAHRQVALALVELVTMGLPKALLVAGGTLAAMRLLEAPVRPLLVALFVGLFACHAYWVAQAVLLLPQDLPQGLPQVLPPDQPVTPFPPGAVLMQMLFPPWWSWPNVLSPWAGFAVAAWLVLRRRAASRV
jgi:hypothetical protein